MRPPTPHRPSRLQPLRRRSSRFASNCIVPAHGLSSRRHRECTRPQLGNLQLCFCQPGFQPSALTSGSRESSGLARVATIFCTCPPASLPRFQTAYRPLQQSRGTRKAIHRQCQCFTSFFSVSIIPPFSSLPFFAEDDCRRWNVPFFRFIDLAFPSPRHTPPRNPRDGPSIRVSDETKSAGMPPYPAANRRPGESHPVELPYRARISSTCASASSYDIPRLPAAARPVSLELREIPAYRYPPTSTCWPTISASVKMPHFSAHHDHPSRDGNQPPFPATMAMLPLLRCGSVSPGGRVNR